LAIHYKFHTVNVEGTETLTGCASVLYLKLTTILSKASISMRLCDDTSNSGSDSTINIGQVELLGNLCRLLKGSLEVFRIDNIIIDNGTIGVRSFFAQLLPRQVHEPV
jgi:hypothetical protein